LTIKALYFIIFIYSQIWLNLFNGWSPLFYNLHMDDRQGRNHPLWPLKAVYSSILHGVLVGCSRTYPIIFREGSNALTTSPLPQFVYKVRVRHSKICQGNWKQGKHVSTDTVMPISKDEWTFLGMRHGYYSFIHSYWMKPPRTPKDLI